VLSSLVGALSSGAGNIAGQLYTRGFDRLNLDEAGLATLAGFASSQIVNLARVMAFGARTAIAWGGIFDFALSPAISRASEPIDSDIQRTLQVPCR